MDYRNICPNGTLLLASAIFIGLNLTACDDSGNNVKDSESEKEQISEKSSDSKSELDDLDEDSEKIKSDDEQDDDEGVERSSSSRAKSSSSSERGSSSSRESISVGGFKTWFGDEGLYQVQTGLGNSTKTFGFWTDYNDAKNGGQSFISYPASKGNIYSNDAMDNIIEACQGVCGTITLDKGTLNFNPFIGISFDVVGETSTTDKTPAAGDASSWGGLCMAYSTNSAGAILELGLGEAVDKAMDFGNPYISLPKGDNMVVDASWSEFKMPSWANKYGVVFDGETAAKQLVAVKFKVQDAAGNYTFNIMSVGPHKGGCAPTGSAVAYR